MNRQELEMLYGYDEFIFKLYFAGIRRYMDYQTGIVGIKRGISWQSLREMTQVESRSGVKEKYASESKVRRAVKTLIRIGLLKNKSTPYRLIFQCPIATQDNCVQNKVDGNPTPLSIGDVDTYKRRKKPMNTGSSAPLMSEVGTEANTGLGAEADTPPLSVKEKELLRSSKKKMKCQLPIEFEVTDQHLAKARENNWPDPHTEIDAFKDYHLSHGSTFADWDRAFYTWLRNAKRFKVREINHGQSRNEKPNSVSRAIDNILNSPSRSS